MKLSVVIVNYNVEHFLEQCLTSVRQAMQGIEGEVFVVDNKSVDGSVQMVKKKFPEVILIENSKNLGFSRANNQAIRQSKGEYILLLNPDTIVEETTFTKVVEFMDNTPDAGGLGVMMVDGKGNFLPESKRGLPTPEVSFYKIFGLSSIFPRSKKFGKYHLTYLDKNEIHQVDVLSGAFMLLRRKTLDITGLLDETFFMYGEDIDLSYRILQAGYKNYYFPKTRIIHYKGESTKKSSVNYVFVFYNAMIIFARKHYAQKKLKLFIALINMAIWFRAGLALLSRFIKKILIPFLDIAFIGGGLYFLGNVWQKKVIFPSGGSFPTYLFIAGIAVYTLVWMFSVFLNGGYDKPVRLGKITLGTLVGTGFILIGYSLLPEEFRFSRAIILLGTIWTLIYFLLSRFILHKLKIEDYVLSGSQLKRIVIIGEEDETKRVSLILNKSGADIDYIHFIPPVAIRAEKHDNGFISQLNDLVHIYKINEIIFCAKNIPAHDIISLMSGFSQKPVEFKIAPPESMYIIGSNNINHPGDFYVYNINNISRPENLRRKRLLDINMSLLLLIFSPVFIFLMKSPFGFIKNIFVVLSGSKSWVGYDLSTNNHLKFPKIRKGIFSPSDFAKTPIDNPTTIDNLNLMYARDYKVWNDFQIVLKNFRNIGRK
jgi:GT2 family glycosyltransferase